MTRLLRFVPLIVLAAFIAAVAWRLGEPADDRIASKLVGKPVPAFALEPALPERPGLSSADLGRGEPRLVNIFASWCVPCIAEAPMLLELSRRGVAIDAIAVRDRPEAIADFLARHGDPFDRIGSDPESRAQLSLGASGVPESFIVDSAGVIRFHHMGPIEEGDVKAILGQWEAVQ